MNWLLLGWLRPVRERKADSRQRLRPSAPDRQGLEPQLAQGVAQLAQGLQRRLCLGLVAEGVVVERQRAGRQCAARGCPRAAR